jgi:TolB protein
MQIDVDVSAKEKSKIPICIVKFKNNNNSLNSLSQKIFNTINNDLIISDNFNIFKWEKSNVFQFTLPREILKVFNKAEFIISGELGTNPLNNNEIYVTVKIYDIFLKKNNLYKRFYGKKTLYRKIAHKISNNILQVLTGNKGIFENRILFVSNKTGNKQIYLMDYDGKGIKQLVKNNSINLSPKIFENYLYFTSFKNGKPEIFVKNLVTGTVSLLIRTGHFSASPDINYNQQITAMLEKGGDSEIVILNKKGKLIKQITDNIFNESSPVWSHKGDKIAFVSNRTGTPQIYIFDLNKNILTRLTYTSKYCAYPSWSSDDTYIYFAALIDGKFKICRMGVGEMHYEQLTFGDYSEEFPSISKNNKFLLFTRKIRFNRQIFIKNIETGKILQVTFDKSDKSYPSWYYGNY